MEKIADSRTDPAPVQHGFDDQYYQGFNRKCYVQVKPDQVISQGQVEPGRAPTPGQGEGGLDRRITDLELSGHQSGIGDGRRPLPDMIGREGEIGAGGDRKAGLAIGIGKADAAAGMAGEPDQHRRRQAGPFERRRGEGGCEPADTDPTIYVQRPTSNVQRAVAGQRLACAMGGRPAAEEVVLLPTAGQGRVGTGVWVSGDGGRCCP